MIDEGPAGQRVFVSAPIPDLDSLVISQTPITMAASNKLSDALNDSTEFVIVWADADALIAYGDNPDATGSILKLFANTPKEFGVSGGKKFAVVTA